MRHYQQSESVAAKRDLFVQMVDGSDYVTAETGLTLTVEIVKAGAASYSAIAGSSAEIGNGTYKISLAAADLNTLGEAMLKITATGAATQFVPLQVSTVSADATTAAGHTPASVADAVWDEATAGHTTAGSTAKQLTDIGSDVDQVGNDIGSIGSDVSTTKTRVTTALPNVAPAANGGLPTVNANNQIAGIAGSINTFDELDLSGVDVVTVTGFSDDDFNSEIVAGEDRTSGLATTVTVSNWAGFSLTGATCKYRAVPSGRYYSGTSYAATFEKALTMSVVGSTITISVELTTSESAALANVVHDADPNYRHQIWILNSAGTKGVVVREGWLTIKRPITASA